MNSRQRTTALACLLWSVSATAAPAITSPEQPPVAGRVGSETITTADLELRLASELQRLRNEDYELRRQALDMLVQESLLQQEAARRDLTVEELLQREVRDQIRITQEEIDAAWEMNREQITESRAVVDPQIRAWLAQQEEAAGVRSLVARLSERFPVQRFLEPPRTMVGAEGFPSRGKPDAAVTIVEFSDFECPFSARVQEPLKLVLDNYGDQVRLVFRNFPLNIHPFAPKVAEASLCALDQERFWEMHDALFAAPGDLDPVVLRQIGAVAGLDPAAFNDCLDSGRHAERVAADIKEAEVAGVNGTPALFINGRFVNGAVPYEELAAILDEELAAVRR